MSAFNNPKSNCYPLVSIGIGISIWIIITRISILKESYNQLMNKLVDNKKKSIWHSIRNEKISFGTHRILISDIFHNPSRRKLKKIKVTRWKII